MSHTNIEIKARTSGHDKIREILKSSGAEYIGTDHQIDTYFNVGSGRLKLREGNIENSLIYYERENRTGPKNSSVILYKHNQDPGLKEILIKTLGVLAVVVKKREIYFIKNVKFHLDNVGGLGKFVEIEVIDNDESIGNEKLLEQCNFYIDLFNIKNEDRIAVSYSDMVLH